MIIERLLRRDPNAGTVVSVSADAVTVATPSGPVSARREGATAYQVGDRVRLSGGVVVGRLRAGGAIVRV